MRAASIILPCVGIACVFLLFLQYLDVYFSLDGTRPLATDHEVLRYRWTAGICVTTMAAAFMLALVARKRRSVGFGVAGFVGLLLAIAASVAFAIPHDHARVSEESHPLPSNYQPCYSGSGDCD